MAEPPSALLERAAERWLPVPGYEEWYSVSDHGRVRSTKYKQPRFLRPRSDKSRYGHVSVQLCRDGVAKSFRIHVLVMLAFVGPRPDDMEVCHFDGDPTNNTLTNLRYDTASANEWDKVRHGTHHQLRKTNCPQGHPYDDENTSIDKRGYRFCRACWRASGRRKTQRKQARAVLGEHTGETP